MKESTLWLYLKTGMGTKWSACRHEDAVTLGVPDISFGLPGSRGTGWIELKILVKLPEKGVVQITKYVPHQRRWIQDRGRTCGNVWLLLQAGDYYLLFDWRGAVDLVGRVDAETLMSNAIIWHKRINFGEFADVLANGVSPLAPRR